MCGRRSRGGGPLAAVPSPAARRAPAAAATAAQIEIFCEDSLKNSSSIKCRRYSALLFFIYKRSYLKISSYTLRVYFFQQCLFSARSLKHMVSPGSRIPCGYLAVYPARMLAYALRTPRRRSRLRFQRNTWKLREVPFAYPAYTCSSLTVACRIFDSSAAKSPRNTSGYRAEAPA